MEQKTKIITDIRDWLQEAAYKYSGEDLVNAFELKFSRENITPIEDEFRTWIDAKVEELREVIVEAIKNSTTPDKFKEYLKKCKTCCLRRY